MSITYHYVTSWSHPAISLARDSRLSRSLFDIVEDLGLQGYAADEAVVAYRRGKIVGILRYGVLYGRSICAKGTLVIKSMRRQGIAAKLWDLAIRRKNPACIHVFTSSSEGLKLARKLSKTYSKIDWQIK